MRFFIRRPSKINAIAAPVNSPVAVTLGGAVVKPLSAVAYASGAYQIALVVPNIAAGEQPLRISTGGTQAQANLVVTVQ